VALILAAALLAPAALLIAVSLGIAGRAELVAGTLVIAAAIVVSESIVLSLVRCLTRDALLVAQAIWLGGAVALWRARGRPRAPSLRPPAPAAVWQAARANPLLAGLAVLVVLVLLFQAFLAISVAPNEYDSLSYHLPRAAFWLQHHSALQYAPSLDDPEQVYPPNAELLVAWTMAMTRLDAFTQLVQWLAMVGLVACIFRGGGLIGLRRAPSAFAAGLFALLPVPMLQSATVQNDLVLSFFLIAALVFAVRGLRSASPGPLLIGALSAGLALGTKLDAVLAVPAFLVVLIPTLISHRPPRGLVLQAVGMTAAAVLALSSFVYVQNIANLHSFSGSSGGIGTSAPLLAGEYYRTRDPLLDAARVSWDFLDAPGLPQPRFVASAATSVASHLFAGVHEADFQVPPEPAISNTSDPDTSAYGLLGLLLLAPLVLVTAFRRRAPPSQRILALAALAYFWTYVLALGYTNEAGRLLMPATALAMPLVGTLMGSLRWQIVALVLTLATLRTPLFYDDYKPVISTPGTPSVLTLNRIQQQTVDDSLTGLAPALEQLDGLVGRHGTLGWIEQDNFPEYLLFGEPLQRRIVGLSPAQVTPQLLRSGHLRGVFIAFAAQPPCSGRLCLSHTAGLEFRALAPGTYLVTAAR